MISHSLIENSSNNPFRSREVGPVEIGRKYNTPNHQENAPRHYRVGFEKK